LKEKPAGDDPNPIDDDKDFLFDEDPPEEEEEPGFYSWSGVGSA
jgi:hypothetical protein